MTTTQQPIAYSEWNDGDPSGYKVLWDPLLRFVDSLPAGIEKRAFDLGSGNGITAEQLWKRNWRVTGVEPSDSGLSIARRRVPECRFEKGTGYDDLAKEYGQYPLVICMEVLEHCYYVHSLAKTFYDLIEPGGVGILTTPYHGYWKNLALSVTNHWDDHLKPLIDGGHIKFFSRNTLSSLLVDAGFTDLTFKTIGRIPPFAMSHFVICRKPK